jgi:putative membrane protein
MKGSVIGMILSSVVFLFSCAPDGSYGPMHGPGGGWQMMPWLGGWFMWLIPVIVIVLVIYFMLQSQKGRILRETPLESLKRRYAKGEITKEEYDRIKQDLSE